MLPKSFPAHVKKHHRLHSKTKKIVAEAKKVKTESQMKKYIRLLKAHGKDLDAHTKQTLKMTTTMRKSHSKFMNKMRG
jgi:hypothetical protein